MVNIEDIQLPPHSSDVEKALLGNVFMDNDLLADCYIQPNHFYHFEHQVIFARMQQMYKLRQMIDVITIQNEDLFAKWITQDFLYELSVFTMTTSGRSTHQDIIKRKYYLREIIKYTTRIKAKAYDPEVEYELDDIMKDIKNLSDIIQIDWDRETLGEAVTNVIMNIWEILPTICKYWFAGFDNACTGYKAWQLIIIAARPSAWKTTMALNLSKNVAENGHKALFLSLEMTMRELATNTIAGWANIENRRIPYATNLISEIAEKSQDGIDRLWGRLTIIDNVFSPMDILNTIRKKKLQEGLDVVFIDYVWIVKYPRKDLLTYEIGEFTRQLKQTAKELDIAIVLLSQLNRDSTKKNEPSLEDLRDSGALEQDADMVTMLQRDDYNEKQIKAFIRKNRWWPKWEFDIWVSFETATLYDIEQQANLFDPPTP